MLNKLLKGWDKSILGLSEIAKACKAIPHKCFAIVAVFDACCAIVAFLGEDKLKDIKIINANIYDTIANFWPAFTDGLSTPTGKSVVVFITIAVFLMWALKILYRQPALLIVHSTMGHDLSNLDANFRKSFYAKRIEIGHRIPSQNASKAEIIQAIKAQDETFANIKKTNWRSIIFYYGVAHTPFIFRLGHQFGQTCRIRLLHRFRVTEDAQEFKELPCHDDNKAAWVNCIQPDNNRQSNELLVAIATTYPIKDEDLRTIDPDNAMYIYKVEIDRKDYDFFSSYNKIRSYADRIAEDIRLLVKEKGIRTIHLAISSSVPFTFYLAQQMNTQQYPSIIVYQYEPGRYTWGIDIRETDHTKAVIRCEVKEGV